jgi:hypothetical protein
MNIYRVWIEFAFLIKQKSEFLACLPKFSLVICRTLTPNFDVGRLPIGLFPASLIIVALIALPSVLAFDGAFEYLQPDRFYLSFIDYGIGISQMKNEVIRVVDAPAARRPVYDRKGSQILVRRGGRRTDIHIG